MLLSSPVRKHRFDPLKQAIEKGIIMLTPVEKRALTAFKAGGDVIYSKADSSTPNGWLCFGIYLLLKAGAMIRNVRLEPMESQVSFKPDKTPVTKTDVEIEAFFRKAFNRFSPDTEVIGEENGGTLSPKGLSVAVDPIDGTWAFVNRLETCATSLLLMSDSLPFMGMVLNPVSGELAYGGDNIKTRLLQMSVFGEKERGYDLPLDRVSTGRLLVNVHPQARGGRLLARLYAGWEKQEIRMVRSVGGSPAYALLDAAKGTFSYTNLWAMKPAEPYDIAAGILLVRGAGGEVIDLYGKPVNLFDHEGPFVAGTDLEAVKTLQEICCDIMKAG